MNRAAETATADVKDIFFEAIKNMTINDGMKILKGDSIAATRYLKSATKTELTQKIKPIVDEDDFRIQIPNFFERYTACGKMSNLHIFTGCICETYKSRNTRLQFADW